MALDEDAMAALVKANLEAITDYPIDGQSPVIVDLRLITAFCKGIIDHIKNAGVVTTTGVQPGAATRTGTIS